MLNINFVIHILIFASSFLVQGHLTLSGENTSDLSLYKGEDIAEFLSVCRYPNHVRLDEDDFESYYPSYTNLKSDDPNPKRCAVLELGVHDGMTEDEIKEYVSQRFTDLRTAQKTVRLYHDRLNDKDFYIHLGLFALIILCGCYLILVGHYNFRTIYDMYYPDHSHGMPCWQYVRMKYIASKVKDNVSNKTVLVPTDDNDGSSMKKGKKIV